MKRLLLLRHAKSDWTDAKLSDRDRPLNARGRRAAARMGRYLAGEGLIPDAAFVSAAARTRETWRRMTAAAAGDWPDAAIVDRLYLADPKAYLDVLAVRAPGRAEAVLMLGHNPGIQALAIGLCGAGDPDGLAAMRAKYPTGALALIEFGGGWESVAPRQGRLVRFVQPRLLDG